MKEQQQQMRDVRKQLKQQHLRYLFASWFCTTDRDDTQQRMSMAMFMLRYLEQKVFIEQLQSLFSEVFACIETADNEKAADKALRRQGFQCAQQVYHAAYNHLQVGPW